MRQIKFRGLSVFRKEWVYGYYAYLENKNGWMVDPNIVGIKKHIIFHGKLADPIDRDGYLHFASYTEVVPETVEQFTGLLDKNGKEIYDGDVVSYSAMRQGMSPAVVKWSDDGGYWKLESKLPCLLHRADKAEVIGNIHENPELLGEQK